MRIQDQEIQTRHLFVTHSEILCLKVFMFSLILTVMRTVSGLLYYQNTKLSNSLARVPLAQFLKLHVSEIIRR